MILFSRPLKSNADDLQKPPTKQDLVQLVYEYADYHNVNPKVMIATINCENDTWDPLRQSDYYKNGKREQSYGLAQIHLPAHPEITKEDAQDPNFALNFMAEQMSKGKASAWSCYRKLYK